MSYDDSQANDHARIEGLERLLHRRDVRVDSVEDFGLFTSIVIEEWHAGCPGLRSSAATTVELAKLGTVVQTSVTLPSPPSLSYHIEWIADVLHAALEAVAGGRAQSQRRHTPNDDDLAYANELIQIWAQADIHQESHQRIADRRDTSKSTVTRRTNAGKRHIHTALERAKRLNA